MTTSTLVSRGTLTAIALAGLLATVSGSRPQVQPDPDRLAMVKAMTFDVFGTVVDWRSSIVREGEQLTARTGIEVDWPRFADAWRARVRSGHAPGPDRRAGVDADRRSAPDDSRWLDPRVRVNGAHRRRA